MHVVWIGIVPMCFISQEEELVGLRSSHDRRLERMRTLEMDYNLLLEQLKTYETKG